MLHTASFCPVLITIFFFAVFVIFLNIYSDWSTYLIEHLPEDIQIGELWMSLHDFAARWMRHEHGSQLLRTPKLILLLLLLLLLLLPIMLLARWL